MLAKLFLPIRCLVASLVLSLTTCVPAQTSFTRVTNTVLTASSLLGGGAAWADFDRDGFLDLAQANYGGENLLFRNNGDGTFTKIVTNGFPNTNLESYGVSWGDFDNNGYPDLFFGDGYETGYRNLLMQNATYTFNFLAITNGPGSPGLNRRSSGCAWADYDRDGLLDLFVANSGSPSELWHNFGNGNFERILTGTIVTDVADSIGAAWADYDNDGWPDLFVANGYGTSPQKNFLYHNNRNGTFTRVTSGAIVNDVAQFCGAAWGDYDNDGFPDLFVTSVGGHNFLYHNNGNGTFTPVTQGDIVHESGDFISAGWADYDNDGWLDLFVGNRAAGGKNLLFHNNGDGTFAKVTVDPMAHDIAPNSGCAWGDYDNDGFPDLFVSVLGGNSFLYHNNGTTNHWLRIQLEDATSNRSAIGAKVRITANIGGRPITQMREINTGDGFNGNSQEALFGMGDATNLDHLRIEWPSGKIEEHNDWQIGFGEYRFVENRQFRQFPPYLPISLISGSDGKLYGTATQIDGRLGPGFVFRLNPDGSGFAVLAEGSWGMTVIEGRDGLLYGETADGGANGNGCIFRLNKDGSGYVTLHSFETNQSAIYPSHAFIQGSDGTLYGAVFTSLCGDWSCGSVYTLFRMGNDGRDYTTINPSLPSSDSGIRLRALLQGSDGSLYGLNCCDDIDQGTVFSLKPDGTGYTVLHHFDTAAGDSPYPNSLIEASDGALYGASYGPDGLNGVGTVFRLQKDGSGYEAIFRCVSNTNYDRELAAGRPFNLLEGRDGTLYGSLMKASDAAAAGTLYGDYGGLFRLNKDGSGFTELAAGIGGCPFFECGIQGRGAIAIAGGLLFGSADDGTIRGIFAVPTGIPAPKLLSSGLSSNLVPVRFTTSGFSTNQIQRAPALGSAWTFLTNVIAPPDGVAEFIDPSSPSSSAFYRVLRLGQ